VVYLRTLWKTQVGARFGQNFFVMHRKFPGNVARWPQLGPLNCGNFL